MRTKRHTHNKRKLTMASFGTPGKEESAQGQSTGGSRSTTQIVVPPHPAVASAVLDTLEENDGYTDFALRSNQDGAISREDLPEELQEQLPEGFGAVSFEDIFDIKYNGADGYGDGVEYITHPEQDQDTTSEDVEDSQQVYPGRAGHLYHAWRYMTAWYYPEIISRWDENSRVKIGKASSRSARGFEDENERLKFVGFSITSDEKGELVVTGQTEKGQSRNTKAKALQAVHELVDSDAVEKYLDEDNEYNIGHLKQAIKSKREDIEPWNRPDEPEETEEEETAEAEPEPAED